VVNCDHSDNEDDDTDTEDEDNDYESSLCSDSDSDMWQRMNNLNANVLSEVTVFSEVSLGNFSRNFKVILVETSKLISDIWSLNMM